MPRQANGNYTLPAGNPVESNTLITPSWANPTMSDIGNALSDSLSRSGLGGMTAELLLDDGLVNIPGLGFTLESNTGFYRPAARVLAVAVNGAGVALFNPSGIAVPGSVTVGMLIAATGSSFAPADNTAGRWKMGDGQAGSTALRFIAEGSSVASLDAVTWDSSGVTRNLSLQGDGGNLLVGTGSGISTDKVQIVGDVRVQGKITSSMSILAATTTTLTNDAAAQTATLTNSPLAGNPTKWIQIDDNGTTRRIPAW